MVVSVFFICKFLFKIGRKTAILIYIQFVIPYLNFWVPFWSALGALQYLNLSRCHITDDGSERFSSKFLQESLMKLLAFVLFSILPLTLTFSHAHAVEILNL